MTRIACAVVALVAFSSPLVGRGEPTGDDVVELPPLVISASSGQTPWRYVEVPGCETLSTCSVKITQSFVRRRYILHQMLHAVLPERFFVRTSAPWTVILVSDADLNVASQEVATALVRAESWSDMERLLQADITSRLARTRPLGGEAPRPQSVQVSRTRRPVRFLPNLRLSSYDSGATYTILREKEFNGPALRLANDHVRSLLRDRTPRLPTWFIDGFMTLYDTMQFHERTIAFSPFPWFSKTELTEVKMHRQRGSFPADGGPLLPMGEMFSNSLPDDSDAVATYARKRRRQTGLFLRWCIEPKEPARQQALFNLLDHATAQPVTAAVFEQYFGRSFEAMELELCGYLLMAVEKSFHLRTPGIAVPAAEVRAASRHEIGRLLGEWERVVIGYVQDRYPEYADKYAAQAYRTVTRAHNASGRDVRLSALLGLLECDLQNRSAAQPHLEAAVSENLPRPRIYLELARLRLDSALGHGGEETLLPAETVAEILKLLFAARGFSPALPETYQLIAETWSRSLIPPRDDHLTVLDEGVHLFPSHPGVVHRAAALYAKNGFKKKARALAELGLIVTADTEGELPFHELLAELDAAR